LGIFFFTFLILHTLIRIVRHFYKFPLPQFAANIIDNPLRRRIQPPEEMPLRQGIMPGMKVLEIGPGNGTYTVETARFIGDAGQLMTIDIEPKMIERVNKRIKEEGINNIDARVADVFDLPFEDDYFDVVYMITVIGEIPTPQKALQEFYRVLRPGGKLVFSELLLDPDYPCSNRLKNIALPIGFIYKEIKGNFFSYSILFEKSL
jgi:ubiquinone/menaquinone biosynthesis C-methylase UbiE